MSLPFRDCNVDCIPQMNFPFSIVTLSLHAPCVPMKFSFPSCLTVAFTRRYRSWDHLQQTITAIEGVKTTRVLIGDGMYGTGYAVRREGHADADEKGVVI